MKNGEKKIIIHKTKQIGAMAHDRNSIFKGEPTKIKFGSNSLSLLHPLEGTTFKVSLISVLEVDLHNTFLQMSQLN